ncbi:MAG: hypothetical protein NTV63_00635 [Candidatus Woesearchaeota archaeon]|nr:hypothetical protein [Candidatus Woesearchaeota archaeon]
MSSGRIVYESICEKIGEVEGEYNTLNGELYSNENIIQSFSEKRNKSYAELAKIYLPKVDAEAVANTLPELQEYVQKVFGEKQRRRKRAESLINVSGLEKAALEKNFSEADEALEEKVKEIDGVKSAIVSELNSDKEYAELTDTANKAYQTLEQNKKRYEAVKTEDEKKLAEYNNNPLFTYLLKRGYDEKHSSRMDRFVAKIISYEENKRNYDFLTSMPEAIKKEIEKRQQDLESLLAKIKNKEEEKVKEHGLDKLTEQGTVLGEKRKAIMAEIEKSDSDYAKYIQEIKGIDDDKGDYYRAVIANLESYLSGKDISVLKKIASSTSIKEDDALLAAIETADKKIAELKKQAKSLKKEQSAIGEKLEGLKKLQENYTQKDYESSRSYFDDGFNIGLVLQNYMSDSWSKEHMISEMGRYQHFRREEHAYDSGPSSSYSHRSRSSFGSGGGFGSGGFSSGGGFGGGGFSSGGGFGH